jgi:hypothetical protein
VVVKFVFERADLIPQSGLSPLTARGREYALAVAAEAAGCTRPRPVARHALLASVEPTVTTCIPSSGQVVRHLLGYPSERRTINLVT